MMPIQVLGTLLLIGALLHVLLRWRSRSLRMGEVVFWILVFGSILTVVLVPSVSGRIARLLGVGRGADVIIYGSIALLFYLVFRVYVRIESLQRRLTRIMRKQALGDVPSLSPADKVEMGAKDANNGNRTN
jgi:hypothetical protein